MTTQIAPIHPIIHARTSPRAYAPRPIDLDTLERMLEAARWAASAFNAQPWRYLVTLRDTPAFERMLAVLAEGNRAWAHNASALILTLVEREARYGWHDLGLSTAQLVLQGEAEGVKSHIMAGFSKEQAREAFAIPADLEPVTVIAVGYPGDPEALPENLRQRETAPRSRRPLAETAFLNDLNTPFA